jgi:hypothetical protein
VVRVKIYGPRVTINAHVHSQAHRDAVPTVQDDVHDTVLLKQANHAGFTASLASTSRVAATDMASVDVATVNYATKERRAEANNAGKESIALFNHDRRRYSASQGNISS